MLCCTILHTRILKIFHQTVLNWQESLVNSIYIVIMDQSAIEPWKIEIRLLRPLCTTLLITKNFDHFRSRIIYNLTSETVYKGVPY